MNNSVELVNYWGSDLSVVNAARVSMGKHKDEIDEADVKLIKYLITHDHVSTLTHCGFTFRLKIPIFIARQLMRHKSWDFNEISGRYVEFQPEFYYPDKFRLQDASIKQGSKEDTEGTINQVHARRSLSEAFLASYGIYESLLSQGVCKEQARMVLPLSLLTELYATCNLRSFMHFLKLRLDSHAQQEIRELAEKMLFLVRETGAFNESLKAFGYE